MFLPSFRVGIAPLRAASYATLREIPSRRPASGQSGIVALPRIASISWESMQASLVELFMSPNMHPETPLCLCRMTCTVRSNGIHKESEVAKAAKESDRQATYRLVAELGSEKYIIERIRDEMKARGWSQAELSRRMVESTSRSGGVLAQG